MQSILDSTQSSKLFWDWTMDKQMLNGAFPSTMLYLKVMENTIMLNHMMPDNLKPCTLQINSQLRSSCWQAPQRYYTHLNNEKKLTEQLSSDKARTNISTEIEELQTKISALHKSNKLLDQKFDSLVRNSEKCTSVL